MDIHRCRFVPYPASPINSLAFSHISIPEKASPPWLRLAVGRANGNIEIWNPGEGAWAQESVLHGGRNRNIEGLVWTQDLDSSTEGGIIPGRHRLFSIGSSNTVTEWDLATGMPMRHSSGGNAETWSITVQPRWREKDGAKDKNNQLIALGCADGSIVLLSTDDDELNYTKTIRRPTNSKARVLCLTFCDRNRIAAGYSDGTIWVYDLQGKVKTSMNLGSGPTKAATYVWTIKCLPDKTLVTGDSTGELRFWDLKTYTLTQRLLCHDADVLAIAPSYDGSILFSGGMDRKVCAVAKDKQTKRWRAVSHQRLHASHVKAMVSMETKKLNVVVSGGVDASPVVTPLRLFGSEDKRMLPAFPQLPPLISAPKARLLVSWWDREVAFCGMDKKNLLQASLSNTTSKAEENDPMQRILVQGDENITSVSITSDAKYIAVATSTCCKVFMLSNRKDDASLKRIRRQDSASLAKQGAVIVSFSPDSRWLLLVTPNNELILYSIPLDTNGQPDCSQLEDLVKLRRVALAEDPQNTLGNYVHTITKIAWSADSGMLACADISGRIDTWTCAATKTNGATKSTPHEPNGYAKDGDNTSEESDESEDENLAASSAVDGFVWQAMRNRIPKLSSLPLVLSFCPGGTVMKSQKHTGSNTTSPDRLLVVTLQHEVLEFHASSGRLTDWSKSNPVSKLPQKFRQIRERVMGNLWDVSGNRRRLWLYGTTFLCMLDMNSDMLNFVSHRSLKRKRSSYGYKTESTMKIKGVSGAGAPVEHPSDYGLAYENDQATGDEQTEDSDEDDDEDTQTKIWQDLGGTTISSNKKSLSPSRQQVNDLSGEDGETARLGSNVHKGDALKTEHKKMPYWSTFKYRPILGVAALEPEVKKSAPDGKQNVAGKSQLEVALVERPLWDLDLDLPFLN